MKKNISTLNAYSKNNHIYMSDIDDWVLVDYDLNAQSVRKIYPVIDDLPLKLFWNEGIIEYGEWLYLVCRNAIRIIGINIHTKEVRTIANSVDIGENADFCVKNAVRVGDKIILFPGNIERTVWEYDISKETFKSIGSVSKIFNTYISEGVIVSQQVIGDEICFIIKDTTKIGWFNVISKVGEIKEYKLSSNIAKILCVSNNLNRFLVMTEDNSIYEIENDNVVRINIKLARNDEMIRSAHYGENKIFVTSNKYENIYLYDLEHEMTAIIKYPTEFSHVYAMRNFEGAFVGTLESDEKIFLLPFSANGMVVIDKKTNQLEWQQIAYDRFDIDVYRSKDGIVKERDEQSISKWIGAINGEHSCVEEMTYMYKYIE